MKKEKKNMMLQMTIRGSSSPVNCELRRMPDIFLDTSDEPFCSLEDVALYLASNKFVLVTMYALGSEPWNEVLNTSDIISVREGKERTFR